MHDDGLPLEEFKARLPLAEIVARHVKLARRGREHFGLCPFHKEKTPSFHVVEDKGFYHCFGCGAHGTAIDFVMQIEHLGFGDALERLAELTGLPAPRRAAPQASESGERQRAANEAAALWFQAQLRAPVGAEAMAYLERRGVDPATARAFGLGYAPDDRTALRMALRTQGFDDAALAAAGLLRAVESGEPYAHFRHRLIFPIADERGRVVGFGGRALGEARAKYLNTPETELFHKGELLYNWHRAKPAARERRELVLAEGYMDVIALAQAGITHAVAPLGTAVTERQLASLWRLVEAPIVCLDGDRAGLAAALRAAERALPVMRGAQTLRFAVLPEGEDPDSYLRRHGDTALRAVLSKAHTLSQMIWRLEAAGERLETPEDRRAASARLARYVRLAGDRELRGELRAQFRALIDRHVPSPRRPGVRAGGETPRGSRWEGVGSSRLAAGISRREQEREAAVLLPLLRQPALLEGHEEMLAQLQFRDPTLERLRQELLAWASQADSLDADMLARHLHRYGFEHVLDQLGGDLAPRGAEQPVGPGGPRGHWHETLAALHRQALLDQERSAGEGSQWDGGNDLNRWFCRLDRLLNRDASDEVDADDAADRDAR